LPIDDGGAALRIVDLRGRLVRTLVPAVLAPEGAITWDGRDQSGTPVASGIYMCEARSGATVRTARLTLLR
jgi:flagellar hook assembly protein FlgD